MLGDVLRNQRGRAIADGLAFQVWVEAEGAVVGAAALALHADAVVSIGRILRKDGRDVWQVHGQGAEVCVALSQAFDGFPALAGDEALAVKRLALDHFQHGLFAFSENPDRALRQLFDELVGKGAEGPAADHDLRVGAGLADQPGMREVGPDAGVVLIQ